MSGQVWPVSIGDYSDYRVVAVCESADEAQRFCDHLNGEKGSIYSDDYVVDEPIQLRSNGDPLPKKVSVWSCTVYDDDRPPSTRGDLKWEHDVHPGGSRFYNGGIGRDWPTPEEAEQHARAWQTIR